MSFLRITMLLGTLTGILLVIGFLLGGPVGTTLALLLAIIINFISYWFSDRIVLRMYGAKPLDDKGMDEMVAKLAHEAKVPKPRLYVVQSDVPNAFATGRNPQRSAVAVTTGIMKLDKDEMEGVIAHEISHIKNRDILISAMAAAIGGAIAYIAQIGYWASMSGDRRDKGGGLSLLLIVIFAPMAALLIRLAISRSEEYHADRTAALITKNPGGLASALRKISSHVSEHPMKHGSTATSHMWIVNPFRGDWFTGMFSTHPPIEKRIERLEEMHM